MRAKVAHMDNKSIKVNPNAIRTRDLLLLSLINGATKAGWQVDRRKEANRRACRENRYQADE